MYVGMVRMRGKFHDEHDVLDKGLCRCHADVAKVRRRSAGFDRQNAHATTHEFFHGQFLDTFFLI